MSFSTYSKAQQITQDLHEFLVCKMMAWIELEYQHVVDSGRPPPICVDAEQEDEQDDEKYTAIHA